MESKDQIVELSFNDGKNTHKLLVNSSEAVSDPSQYPHFFEAVRGASLSLKDRIVLGQNPEDFEVSIRVNSSRSSLLIVDRKGKVVHQAVYPPSSQV